jgi:hypothetical protein
MLVARLGHAESVQSEQDGQRGVAAIEPFRGEQKRTQLAAVHAVALARCNLGPSDVLGRVRGDAAVDVGEAVEPAHRGQPPVDRGSGQTSGLHRAAVELDVGPNRLQDLQAGVGRPLEEHPQIMSIRVECSAAVAGEERRRGKLRLVERRVLLRTLHHRRLGFKCRHR